MNAHESLDFAIFTKGTVIFEEGDAGEDAYLLQSGAVDIVVRRGNADRLIDTLTKGDFFGEMALIDDGPRTASAIASQDCICAVFTKELMDEKLSNADFFTIGIIRLLTKRLRKTITRLE